MLHLEAEWPFKIYVNCRHNFVRTRTLAGFKVWGEQNTFLEGNIFVFVICLKEIFLSTSKISTPCLPAWSQPTQENYSSYLDKFTLAILTNSRLRITVNWLQQKYLHVSPVILD